jgi:hypothetical protein
MSANTVEAGQWPEIESGRKGTESQPHDMSWGFSYTTIDSRASHAMMLLTSQVAVWRGISVVELS